MTLEIGMEDKSGKEPGDKPCDGLRENRQTVWWQSSLFLWLFRVAFLVAMTGVLYLALSPVQPVNLGSDKTNHVFAFTVLGTLAQLSFPRFNALPVVALLLFFGVVIELIQSQVGRFAGMDDVMADLVGLVVSVFIVRFMAWFSVRCG